jgi:hypothetical protein
MQFSVLKPKTLRNRAVLIRNKTKNRHQRLRRISLQSTACDTLRKTKAGNIMTEGDASDTWGNWEIKFKNKIKNKTKALT